MTPESYLDVLQKNKVGKFCMDVRVYVYKKQSNAFPADLSFIEIVYFRNTLFVRFCMRIIF